MVKNSFFAVFLTVSTVAFAQIDENSYVSRHEGNPAVQACAAGVTAGLSKVGSAAKFAATEPSAAFNSVKASAVSATDSVVSAVSPYVPQPAVDAKNYVAGKFAQVKNWAYPTPVVEEKSRFSKVWNATVFGYEGAGKYVVVSAATAAAIVAAYAAYCFAQPTLEDQVVALVGKAQANPNVVLHELPGILAQCSSDDVRVDVLHYVLSQVVITPEIAAAFNLQQ